MYGETYRPSPLLVAWPLADSLLQPLKYNACTETYYVRYV